MKRIIYLLAIISVISSCNKDDVITTDAEKYYRAKTEESNSASTMVFEYTPAPGQFINETKTGGFTADITTAEAASEFAQSRFDEGKFVSLGGFGGYIIVGFDHSIDNNAGYDLAIKGNAFANSSEPGIVWVMQDENGDGKPNDTWYELKGCETGLDCTIQDYEVTYYKPSEAGKAVKWKDNKGNSGEIDYLKSFHKQEYYYPLWINSESYTLKGTCLEARNYDKSGNGSYWIQPEYDWGYADNFSAADHCNDGDSKFKNCNLFDLSNAVDKDGAAANLKFADFIKVQTALNTKSGWLGENSTEVLGFFDYSMPN